MKKLPSYRHRLLIASALMAATLAGGARAAPVTAWRTFRATTATVVDSGQGTNAPVFGNTTTTAASSRFIGYFAPQTLARVGDRISLTYEVSFNDAVGVVNGGDNFRYALFDSNGETVPTTVNTASAGSTDTNGFLGYWAGVKTGSGTDGSLRERFDTTNNDPLANATATSIGSIDGTNVPIAGAVNGVGTAPLYHGELTITRTMTGVDLSGSFGGNGGSNTFYASEPTPISFTYGAVGFLNGNGLSADQVLFQNVDVSYIPAAETLTLEILAVGPHAGAMRLVNKTDAAIDFSYYEIRSDAGSLDAVGWRSLDDQSPISPPLGWGESPASDEHLLSEALILGKTTLAPGAALPLGRGYAGPTNDLRLGVGDGVNRLYFGDVVLVQPGDFDGDGDVDAADLARWKDGVSLTGDFADADFDGDSDGADFLAWQRNLSASSAAPWQAIVPEGGSWQLIVNATVLLFMTRAHLSSLTRRDLAVLLLQRR